MLRPDIVLWSASESWVIIAELTVPWEEGFEEAAVCLFDLVPGKKLESNNLRATKCFC